MLLHVTSPELKNYRQYPPHETIRCLASYDEEANNIDFSPPQEGRVALEL